jgi:Skp family chaperone for outer membrane proteins
MVRRGLISGLHCAALALSIGLALPVAAQDRSKTPSPILTVDQEGLFQRSAFGARAEADLSAEAAALAAENRKIEADLAEEERRLTEQRATMDPVAFRALAAQFDEKVVEIRRTQDQKGRELARRPEEARQEFFRAALDILADLVRERGAVAILDNRAILISADAIDVTDEAIRRIDEVLGDGTTPITPDQNQP